jgi:glutamyl-tRNA synthetase
MQTLADFWPLAAFLVERQPYDDKAWRKVMEREGAAGNLAAVRTALAEVEPFELEAVEAALRGVVEATEAKPRDVFQPLRVAISGSMISPGIFESAVALGREETLARVDSALERLQGAA